MAYLFLFLSAFGAATLLPLQSETVLFSLFVLKQHSVMALLIVATVGNVLGSCVNWWLGVKIEYLKHKKWFPVSENQLEKAQNIYHRYGFYSLLLSWLPVIGDPITLIAGVLKESFWRFLIVVSLAKAGRYCFIYLLYVGVIN
ncbi:YqaA family protein [Acinetobacter ihumii]|uniref:YqaA family protein n=1 Tax=Acinetobacter ihumii TaxID=2483802 RepID=UPI00102F6127|nr:YqaA family protein [Acinetobacter ihumii]